MELYYPFGSGMKGLDWTLNTSKENKWQYNGGVEKNTDFDLNWYETDYRPYDVQISRMTGVDALASLFPSISPYVYSYNNPINFNDPTGLCTDCATDENDFTALAEKYAVKAEKITIFEPIVETITTYTKEVKPYLRPDNVNKTLDNVTKKIDQTFDENENLKYVPMALMLIKAWGLYGKQLLIYGGTTLASGLYSSLFIEAGEKQLANFIKSNSEVSSDEFKRRLVRSINSFEETVVEHEGFLSDPKSHVPHFDKLTQQHQNNLIHHWQQDIKRNAAYRDTFQKYLDNL